MSQIQNADCLFNSSFVADPIQRRRLHQIGIYHLSDRVSCCNFAVASLKNHVTHRTVNRCISKSNLSEKAGVDATSDAAEVKPRCIVLDIEGMTTPISSVTDVLFPYARDNVGRHLYEIYETPETDEDIKLLRA